MIKQGAGLIVIEFEVPVRIESEMNRREHWTVRKKRFDEHKLAMRALWPVDRICTVIAPTIITLTRIGPRKLDSDNLAGGFKAVRDQIAKMIGVDDGDWRLTWRYEQEKGAPKEYKIRVKMEAA